MHTDVSSRACWVKLDLVTAAAVDKMMGLTLSDLSRIASVLASYLSEGSCGSELT